MAYWCVNFDGEAGPMGKLPKEYVLRHGLQEQAWLMHYQYSHGGHIYQGHPDQVVATTTNWRSLGGIRPGDWLAAYLPSSRFFSVGEVITRRKRERHLQQVLHRDTIARTTCQHGHRYLQGIVDYTDASAFYEDFTDEWSLDLTNPYSQLPETWAYPQRVDVAEWKHVVEDGVEVRGLAQAAPFPAYRRAAFEIPESFFEKIRVALQQAGG